MIEIGVFHNGASDLPPIRTQSGVVVNDGSLADVHASNQRTVVNRGAPVLRRACGGGPKLGESSVSFDDVRA